MVNGQRNDRRSARGAAIFVVVLVLTMLTAIGVFAVRAASLSGASSGYERQSAQNQNVAELAMVATVSELGTNRRNQYVSYVRSGKDLCLVNKILDAGVDAGIPCYKVYLSDLVQQGIVPFSTVSSDAGGAVGSFGAAPVEGDFMVEMSDPGPAGMPVAGSNQGGGQTFSYLQMTLTSTGQVRPIATGPQDIAAASRAGNASSRAYVVVGPVPP